MIRALTAFPLLALAVAEPAPKPSLPPGAIEPAPSDPFAALQAERRPVIAEGCIAPDGGPCRIAALVVASATSPALCIDDFVATQRFAVGDGAFETGYLANARFQTEPFTRDQAIVEAMSRTTRGGAQAAPRRSPPIAVLVRVPAGGGRLCFPLTLVAGKQLYHLSSSRAYRMSDVFAAAVGGVFAGAVGPVALGSLDAPRPKPFLVGASRIAEFGPDLSTFADYLFGSSANSLVAITISTARPGLPVVFRQRVLGRTRWSYQVAASTLAELAVIDGDRRVPVSSCHYTDGERRDYHC